MNITLTATLKKILLVFLIIGGLYFGKVFFMPLCFGGILATLFLPFCNWLEHKKCSKALAIIICLLTIIIAVGSILSLFGWKIAGLIKDVELLKERLIDSGVSFQDYIFNRFGLSVADQLLILKQEQPSYSNIMQNIAGSISNVLANLILILIYFIFLLYYRSHIKQFLLKLTEESHRLEMENIVKNTAKVSQQYLIGLSKMIFLLWIMYSIGFSIIGVKNAIFFAILCGLLEIVPYLGNIFGTLITIIIASLQGGDLSLLLKIALVYGVVQTIQGWLLEPLILGPQVKINPLFTIVVLIVGQLLWGIPGIILAIPLSAMLKIICDHVEPLKPYGFLIGEIKTSKIESNLVNKLKEKFRKV
jgi:predicted PurR-regulated permease PerM